MNREQVRNVMLDGADRIRNSPVWRFMSSQQQAVSIASRQTVAEDNAVTNAYLDAVASKAAGLQAEDLADPPTQP